MGRPTVRENRLKFRRFTGDAAKVHTLTGRADLDSRTVDASLTTSHIRVEQLLPLVGKDDLPLTGWADIR